MENRPLRGSDNSKDGAQGPSRSKAPDTRFLHKLNKPTDDNASTATSRSQETTESPDTENVSLAKLIKQHMAKERAHGEESNKRIKEVREERLQAIGIEIDSMILPKGLRKKEERMGEKIMYPWGDVLDRESDPIHREIRSGGATSGHHEPNEDSCFAEPHSSSYGVFDGLGGKDESYIASRIASRRFRTELMKLSDDMSPKEMGEKMEEIFEEVKKEIQDKHPNSNALTTASVFRAMEYKGKRIAVVLNVGDSRIYRLPAGSNIPEHKTNDAGEENPEYRTIQQEIANLEDFQNVLPHLKESVEQRNIVHKSLGRYSIRKDVKPDIHTFELKPGDTIIIISDGVHDNLTDPNIVKCVKDKNSEEAAKDLVKEANKKSQEDNIENEDTRAKEDDITAIVAHFL